MQRCRVVTAHPDDPRFVLDPGGFELRRDGTVVDLEPQAFDVLAVLVRNRERLVTKEELLDEVWGDRFVSESALTTRIKQLRQALGDDGRAQRFVKTVHGRGYRFVGPVELVDGSTTHGPLAPARNGDDRDGDSDRDRSEADHEVAIGRRHNLPGERTTLIGRDGDIDIVLDHVNAHRLVSLLGMGGTGKTRLATAVGRAAVSRSGNRSDGRSGNRSDNRSGNRSDDRSGNGFGHGVWFVDLVPITGLDEIVTAVARAVGLSLSAGDPLDQLASWLVERRLLIVLDNCEHLTDEVAEFVDAVLAATSEPHFLLTSREPVDLPDEHRLTVDPLPVGDSGSAIDLFVVCAERFGATIEARDRPAVIRLCRALDGLPLAIELAAAQLRHLEPDQLAERLDQRFELLVGGRRSGRHRSLAAVLDSTWAGLDDTERAVMRQLAVLPGRFTLTDYEELIEPGPGVATHAGCADRSLPHRPVVGP